MPDVITLVNMGLLRRIKWEPERTAYKPFELPIKKEILSFLRGILGRTTTVNLWWNWQYGE
jgi:hypothetical protein